MNSFQHGSRIIKLDGNTHTYKTYIRNEDGTIAEYKPLYVDRQDDCSLDI